MTRTAVLIPFQSDEAHRLRNLEYVKNWYATLYPDWELIVATHNPGREGWIKALAVQEALKFTDAENLLIADADCVCEGVGRAVEALGEFPWAVPHSVVRRLSREATELVLAGAPYDAGHSLSGRGYRAVAGGGITAIRRSVYEEVPLDPRFYLNHGEDTSWATALKVIVGKPLRGEIPLWHLWHPPIPAMGFRYDSNSKLAHRYLEVSQGGQFKRVPVMKELVAEIKDWKSIPRPQVLSSTATCGVIVPVMRRPEAAERFMDSFRSSGADAVVYAIADAEDTETIQAWKDQGATVVVSDRGSTFACKVNMGVEVTSEPWLFFVGDDVIFHKEWLQEALCAAGEMYSVVSTNDLARSDLDKLAVHPLMKRSYIESVGASLDGPGLVAHEGFKHWFVDCEWSNLARDRGEMVYAPKAIVEHLHPLWKKGETDEVYELGQSFNRQDRRLYRSRLQLYTKKKGLRV